MNHRDELGDAIDRLPAKLRVVIELLAIGYDRTEIAEMLDVQVAVVEKRLAAVKSPRIRRMIQDSGK